jgi:hypothetical protein
VRSEVGELRDAGLGHQDVVGLDVAVDDAGLVRDRECLEHRLQHGGASRGGIAPW